MRSFVAVLLFAAACSPRPTFVEPPLRASVTVTPALAVVNWEKGTNAKEVLIARTSDTGEPTPPTSELAVGDAIGDALVLAISDGTSYRDNKLPDTCGPFSWHLWSRAADGTWAKTASTVRTLKGEHTLAPTAEASNLSATYEGTNVRLSWTNPDVSTSFDAVTVVRKRGMIPASATDGTIVYVGPSDQTVDPVSNLSSSASTFYAVFNCNLCARCGANAPNIDVPPPTDGGTTLTINGLTAVISADRRFVELAWNSTAPRVKVLRTLNINAMGANDPTAAVVYDGPATSTRDSMDNVLPNLPLVARRYRYTAFACIGATCSVMPSSVEFTATLKDTLKAGGYSIYFHHATASTCVDNTSLGTSSTTTRPGWWRSCDATCATATAAQLTSPTADTEVMNIRDFFATNSIPVSHITSSQFCRAIRTAEAFGVDAGVIEQSQQLTYFVFEESNRCRDITSLMNGPPTAGTNALFVGHALFTGGCTVFDGLNPADAVVYRPTSGAPPRFIARVAASEWAGLP